VIKLEHPYSFDPKLEVLLERTVDVPKELVWKAWTTPSQLGQWFCPLPWKTTHCEIDLVPGGKFHTIMTSPEGEQFPNTGCYLEIIPQKRLVWTDALMPGFRPSVSKPMNSFTYLTAIIELESIGTSTKYRAIALHSDEENRKRHEEMGFHVGWSTVLDQMVALIKENKLGN
jgi:uncharacterized protein YndB with AHSA1/START domain